MQLYKIAESIRTAMMMVDEDWVISDEGLSIIENSNLDLQEKWENISKVLLSMDGDISSIDNEIKRLHRKKKTLSNSKERLKSYLVKTMEDLSIEKIETPITKISFRKSKSVTIDDESKVPPRFMRIKMEPNKAEILKVLKESKMIPWCMLSENKSLSIK